jgi:8-oxo-dGTP pyrophosphatase MutT (NUDIX family)
MQEVVVGALVRDGRVLLAHRRPDKRAYPNVWDLPGGVMEGGESERDALTREMDEELGVRIMTNSASHLCRLTPGPAEEPALLSAWLVRDWDGTPANVAPEEHVDIGWFTVEELPPPGVRGPLVRRRLTTEQQFDRACRGRRPAELHVGRACRGTAYRPSQKRQIRFSRGRTQLVGDAAVSHDLFEPQIPSPISTSHRWIEA